MILDHIGLRKNVNQSSNRALPVSVTKCAEKCAEKIVEPYDDGWPEYEEPFVDVQTL